VVTDLQQEIKRDRRQKRKPKEKLGLGFLEEEETNRGFLREEGKDRR
jgi:hypothetical protein